MHNVNKVVAMVVSEAKAVSMPSAFKCFWFNVSGFKVQRLRFQSVCLLRRGAPRPYAFQGSKFKGVQCSRFVWLKPFLSRRILRLYNCCVFEILIWIELFYCRRCEQRLF